MPSCQCVGYTALCTIAAVGFATILVMVLVPNVRADLSFRLAECNVLRNGIEAQNGTSGGGGELPTRAFLKVSFIRDDGVPANGTCYDSLGGAFTPSNKTVFIEEYHVGGNYSCYYDPTDSAHCIMDLQYRTMTLVLVGIAGAMMLVIPMVVCVCTYIQGRRAEYQPINFAPVS